MRTDDQVFIQLFDVKCQDAYQHSVDKGFATLGVDRADSEFIALAHSELSEVLEAVRHGNPPDDKIPEFNGAEAELADCIIRCMNHAGERGWRLGEAIVAKMAFNSTRSYQHGGKRF